MMGNTHMIGGAVFGAAAITVISPSPAVAGVGLACSVFGSLVPDIDHPQAKFAHMNLVFSGLSHFVSTFTSHRKFCHTIPFIAIIAAIWLLLFRFIGGWLQPYIAKGISQLDINISLDWAPYTWYGCLFLCVGMLSHLALDTLNKEGIMWLFPISSKRISLLPITTSSIGEVVVNIVLWIVFAMWGLWYAKNGLKLF